jgi:hypothetical protein
MNATPQQLQVTQANTNLVQQKPVANQPFSQEGLAAMTPEQRLELEQIMRRQQQALFRGQPLNRATAEQNWNNNLPPKLLEIYKEISKAAPSANILSISPEQKAIMTQQLQDSLEVLARLDLLVVHGFPKATNQERNVRNLLAMRIQLMRQFKNTPEWIINDHFTITPDYLTGSIIFVRKLFQMTLVRMNNERRSIPNHANAPVAQAEQPTQTTPLNANNLKQLQYQQQQQEEALQRARRASSQSAPVPPAPFGAPSPQGVPAYGSGGLAPEKLKLPPPKKRKQSQAGVSSSPVPASAPIIAEASYKKAVADAKSAAAPLVGTFKCGVVECQYHFQGFPTQAALDKHVEESHRPEVEEVIDDPFQFYIDSLDIGLGFTANNQGANQVATTSAGPTRLMASPVKPGLATPASSTATPVLRAPNQLPAKSASPATSAQQLTPQQEKAKKPVSKPGALDLPLEPALPWANSQLTPQELADTFDPLFDEVDDRNGLNMFSDEAFNVDAFLGGDLTEATPDSNDLALATQTPQDDLKDPINWSEWAMYDEESALATAEWMNIPLELQDNSGDGIKGVRVDFDRLEREQREQKELSLGGGGNLVISTVR